MRYEGRRLALLVLAITFLCGTPAWAQLGPCATQIGPKLPDLIVDENLLKTQIFLSEETFGASTCTVKEGCVASSGKHVLLRFMSSTPNIGKADLFIGNPSECIGTLFHFSECHQHLHFKEYADYRLWTPEGYRKWVAGRDLTIPTNTGINALLLGMARTNGELVVGRKQGFCMVDIARYFSNAGPPFYLSCTNNQGVSVGWADVYGPQLACQFVQIDNLAEGTYVLEDHVNPEHLLPESDYTNNSSAVTFYFKPKQGKTGPTIEIIESAVASTVQHPKPTISRNASIGSNSSQAFPGGRSTGSDR